jgi:sodium-dependent phosphate cotransporter
MNTEALNTTVPQDNTGWRDNGWLKAAAVLALLFMFLVGVNGLSSGFKSLGSDFVNGFFKATENPLIGLMVGILATTIVQSSSVTTSLIVALVAAPDNPLAVSNAIPMIMGANIGTTVTNTIVSLAHAGRKEEFQRAFAVATCHDFFNFITVAILLPLELATGILGKTAASLAEAIGDVGGVTYESPFKAAIKSGVHVIQDALGVIGGSGQLQALVLIIVSILMIFVALTFVVKVLRSAMQSKVEVFVTRAFGKSIVLSVLIGMIVTVMVQSSSITTSLLVPLAGAGVLSIHHAFPITVGANIGTTVTALLAVMAVSGENAIYGLTIALVHLLFNLVGTVMILPFKAVREIPINMARRLAKVAVVSPRWAILYVILLFYGLPAALAFVDKLF